MDKRDSMDLFVLLSAESLGELGSNAESRNRRLPFAPGVGATLMQAVDAKHDLSVLQQFNDSLEASVFVKLIRLLLGAVVQSWIRSLLNRNWIRTLGYGSNVEVYSN